MTKLFEYFVKAFQMEKKNANSKSETVNDDKTDEDHEEEDRISIKNMIGA